MHGLTIVAGSEVWQDSTHYFYVFTRSYQVFSYYVRAVAVVDMEVLQIW